VWIFLALSAWLLLSIPLALLVASFIGSHKLRYSQTTPASSSERSAEQPADNGNDRPQRPAA
jgi:hypothetical protein